MGALKTFFGFSYCNNGFYGYCFKFLLQIRSSIILGHYHICSVCCLQQLQKGVVIVAESMQIL